MSRRKTFGIDNAWTVMVVFTIIFIIATLYAIGQFIVDNVMVIGIITVSIAVIVVLCFLAKELINRHRKKLLSEILTYLELKDIDLLVRQYDDKVIVKSRQTLDNYSDIKYFKDNNNFEVVKNLSEKRKAIKSTIGSFINGNEYEGRPQYKWVKEQLCNYMQLSDGYRIQVVYVTPAGNNRGQRVISINSKYIDVLAAHPEMFMTKGEFNKLQKQQEKDEVESRKHALYEKVNDIIEYANKSQDKLVVNSRKKDIDELVQKLFDRTVNAIQKVSKLESDEWDMLNSFIADVEGKIHSIVENDKKISDYYESDEFGKIKETCALLTQSQKEFNEYIDEKAHSITNLFGTRIVRNETENDDVYNYFRAYKKSITPFTAEVSSTVFGSAENNPISYIIKYFYPNKSQYTIQLDRLRLLIEELETLKEAKDIIENYKQDYNKYIQDVPQFVMENDEAGFFRRLGLTIIDESVLNVEYRFTYTSNGGMAQRSFAVPMTEENITELILQLENKLSQEALAKEQRALMTAKLRNHIKERDNYTCCQCGNSTLAEPNLLLEIDHIIPVSKGGLTQEDNLQTLCWKCNRNKGAKIVY